MTASLRTKVFGIIVRIPPFLLSAYGSTSLGKMTESYQVDNIVKIAVHLEEA